ERPDRRLPARQHVREAGRDHHAFVLAHQPGRSPRTAGRRRHVLDHRRGGAVMHTTTNERTTNMRTASSMWKGAVAGLAALVGVAGWASSSHANAACGDLNGDGFAKIGDAIILLQTVANPPGAATLCSNGGALQCGDMNGDGTLTIADVVIFLNFL